MKRALVILAAMLVALVPALSFHAFSTAPAMALPVGGGPVGGTGVPLSSKTPLGFTSCFVDPANVSTHANDVNSCATSAVPIRTTTQLNSRLWNRLITSPTTITYMSDDASGTMLDFSTDTVDGSGSLTVNGTPQVLHSCAADAGTCTLNAGTIAINPTAASGGQRQTAHTTDLTAFAPFVFAPQGGGSAHPAYLVIADEPDGGAPADFGSSAWIVSGLGATASLSRPMATDNVSDGTLTIGDPYKIQRGSTIVVGGNLAANPNTVHPTFNDLAFTQDSFMTLGAFQAFYNRCSFDGTLLVPVACNNCYINDISVGTGATFFISAGVWLLEGSNSGSDVVEVTNDTYVTSPIAQPLFTNPNVYGNLSVFATNDPNSGIQLQDNGSGVAAMIVNGVSPVTTGQNGSALIWGNGNAGFGIVLAPNAAMTVPAGAGLVPSVTGGAGDFAFQKENGGTFVTLARAWDDSVGAYTTTRTTTWANFAATIAGGGFGFNAHYVSTNSTITGL